MSYAAVTTSRLREILSGTSLTSRVMRSSAFTVMGYGFSQGLRLLGNLLLTRLLFPEAFGLMALVTVFMVGLQMFSDFGIGPAIAQSKRGDDQIFLNTAWTVQILRGAILFLIGCALAYPASLIYGEPLLFGLLILASVQFLISGFIPTRRDTAGRHLRLGHVTLIEMTSQTIGLISMISLAFWTRSVWSLVVGMVIGTIAQTILMTIFLPGQRNRLRWENNAIHELIHYGKWIFLSTVCGFAVAQGDKLVLGKFLPLDSFGIYNIGFFLGSFSLLLGMMVTGRILIPVYRDRPPATSRENFLKLRKLRGLVTLGILSLLLIVAYSGVWLVELMYDVRYQDAGAVVVLIACLQIPVAIGLTYDQAALAAGDSKRFFIVTFVKAFLTITGLLIGVQTYGLIGALAGQALAIILAYPALVWLSVKIGVWDPLHDLGFAIIGLCLAAGAIWYNWAAISALAA
ncbi:oligosaccharide flippase family protein [Seohaeicola saemankumensis]|uniref:oligosaccharide flippase family protein n=1 Tax=Seohaeicola saemankumensis TaxID=481181 RepID=UPI001E2EA567|nr:oligosaccharide flippase family protein [Seohaeicola saemankumensis]MCD1627353.1 oligosaccharide flippase family protein [Seohaeicola saemankumensis]